MKKLFPSLFLFLLSFNALASPQVMEINCETNTKLEFYLQKVAQEVYGEKFDCDTPIPSDDRAWNLGSELSSLCRFDMFSKDELWKVDYNFNYKFAKPTTIRTLMANLQYLELSDVRCDLSRRM